MGLARDLSMGPKRRKPVRPVAAHISALRRLIAQPDPSPDALRDLIAKVGASPDRLLRPEGQVYNAACTRYRELTGEQVGPETGWY